MAIKDPEVKLTDAERNITVNIDYNPYFMLLQSEDYFIVHGYRYRILNKEYNVSKNELSIKVVERTFPDA